MTDNNTGVTVTLKAGQGFESPWIVIHAADAKDALAQIDTGEFATLAERTVSAAEFFRSAHTVKAGLSTTNPAPAASQGPPNYASPSDNRIQQSGPSWSQQGSQQQAPAPAPQGGKSCVHGAMVYREGTGTKGPWKAYFCPTPKGTQGQCSPEFLR